MRASIIRFGVTVWVVAALAVPVCADAQQYSLIQLVASADFANNLLPGTRIINSAGQVIGNNNNGVGYLYSNGVLTAIPPLAIHHRRPTAFSINNSGQVTGFGYSAGGFVHAFLYSSSSESIIDLGTLYGSSGSSVGLVINAGGQVAGVSTPDGGGYNQVFQYSSGSLINLKLLTPNGNPTGISNTGDIVGTSGNTAYLYSNGVTTNLGPGLSPVISANGHIGGTESIADGEVLGFAYRNGQVVSIGTLNGGTFTFLNAINNKGQATGYGDTVDSSEMAFLYSNGSLTNLGACCGFIQSVGNAINNRGEITGQLVATNGSGHGFLYSHGIMVDLNTLVAGSKLAKSFVIDNGVAINDDGWIVAEGYNTRTFLTYELLLKPEGKHTSP